MLSTRSIKQFRPKNNIVFVCKRRGCKIQIIKKIINKLKLNTETAITKKTTTPVLSKESSNKSLLFAIF